MAVSVSVLNKNMGTWEGFCIELLEIKFANEGSYVNLQLETKITKLWNLLQRYLERKVVKPVDDHKTSAEKINVKSAKI